MKIFELQIGTSVLNFKCFHRLLLMLILLKVAFADNTEQKPLPSIAYNNTAGTMSNSIQHIGLQRTHARRSSVRVSRNRFSGKQKNALLPQTAKHHQRQARLFGLLGGNFSLAYNLTIGGGNTLGNITVAAAPAPSYYYYAPAPAPYYYGGYYNPYAYNPYAYNPYAYDPYAGYYYG